MNFCADNLIVFLTTKCLKGREVDKKVIDIVFQLKL